jgi:photosystem II stability/assembly factor-like uncharacterized protein
VTKVAKQLLWFLFPVYAFAQGTWRVQNPLPTESFLLAVEPVTNNTVFAGGLGGTLLKSTDAGKTWTVRKLPGLDNIRSIDFSDPLSGWLLDSEHVYRTADGGVNWTEVSIQTEVDMSVYSLLALKRFGSIVYLFLKPQTAVSEELINAKSVVLKSTDDGRTWKHLAQEIRGKMLCAFSLNEEVAFLYAEEKANVDESFTTFYKTSDGGETWSKRRFPQANWTPGVYFLNSNTGFVGKYRTTDSGATWEDTFSNLLSEDENVDGIFLTDSLHGWSISGTKVFQTTDGGLSWTETNIYSSHQLTDIDFFNDGTGWVVGWAGNIFRKKPDSDKWESMSVGQRANLNDVFFSDENDGWCVGWSGSILHTSNGGESWEEQPSSVDSVLYSVRFLDNSEGWIAGHDVLLHTTDGGREWKAKSDVYGWFVDIDFFDEKNGLLIERSGAVFRTIDGGKNWQLINNKPLSARLASIAIVTENEAWIGGWQGLGHTADKGATIQWYDVPGLSQIRKVQFVDSNTGFLTNDLGAFLGTTDAGLTWNEFARGRGIEKGSITNFFMHDRIAGWVFVGIAGGEIKHITSSSVLFVDQDELTYTTSSAFNSMFFLNSSEGWAVGAGGTILKFEGQDATPPFHKAGIAVFPNPLGDPGASIILHLDRRQQVVVDVFDLIGQRIQTLHNGVLNQGDQFLKWIPNKVSSGTYFINVRCEDFNRTVRCVYLH